MHEGREPRAKEHPLFPSAAIGEVAGQHAVRDQDGQRREQRARDRRQSERVDPTRATEALSRVPALALADEEDEAGRDADRSQ